MTRSGLIAGTEVGAAFGGISISSPSSSSLMVWSSGDGVMDAAAAPNSPTDEAAALLVAGLLTIAALHGCSASEVHWICWNSSTHVTKMK